jgi:methyl-accepting chemotaxis protein
MDLITFTSCLFIFLFFIWRLIALYSVSVSESIETKFKKILEELYLNKLSDTYIPKLEDVVSISDFYQSIENDRIWNVDYKTIQKTGNTLTGLGILGTFVGLSLGLTSLDLSNGVSTSSILPLLEGMQTAFWTSVVGMCLSLIYNLLFNKHISKLEKQFYGICSKYNSENIVSPTYYLKKQADALANLGGGIGSSIGTEVADVLNKNLSSLISNLDVKMSGMIKNIENLLSETLSNELRKASEGIRSSAVLMENSTNKFEQSIKELDSVVEKSTAMLDNVENILENIEQTVEKVDDITQSINSELGDSATQVQSMSSALFRASAESIKIKEAVVNLDSIVQNIDALTDKQQNLIVDLNNKFTSNIGPKLSDLTAALDEFPETLPTASKLFVAINEGINEYTERLTGNTKLLLDKFTDEFTKACVAVENTAQAIQDSKDTIYNAVNDYNTNVEKVKSEQIKEVRGAYDLLIRDIEKYSSVINGAVQKLNNELNK